MEAHPNQLPSPLVGPAEAFEDQFPKHIILQLRTYLEGRMKKVIALFLLLFAVQGHTRA